MLVQINPTLNALEKTGDVLQRIYADDVWVGGGEDDVGVARQRCEVRGARVLPSGLDER